VTGLHIGILDEELPFPLSSGKRIRTFQLLSRLAQRHRLTFIAHQNADENEAKLALRRLQDCGIRVLMVPRKVPSKSGLLFYLRFLASLRSPLPYSVQIHASHAMRKQMIRLQQTDRVDLWHAEWTPYAQLLHRAVTPWCVMAHNVESLIWQRYHQTETNPLKRWLIAGQYRRWLHFERWCYSQAPRAIAVSPEDAELMKNEFQAERVSVVENGVDPTFFTPQPTSEPTSNILFLGSLDWRPNQDGVQFFLEQVWPRVLAQESSSQFIVVGRKPPAWLRQLLAQTKQCQLHADVPDVRPYLNQAAMLVVPLRVGGGSRLKILEALSANVPVVSTSIGAEGLRLNPELHYDQANSPEAFAEVIVRNLRQRELALSKATQGRQFVLTHYVWDSLADKLDQVWQTTYALAHNQPVPSHHPTPIAPLPRIPRAPTAVKSTTPPEGP
jgi:glycosyltransferase involved in cell wall biosynthesis